MNSSIINISYQSATFVTIDEPAMTHQNYPKSIVYIRVHPWYCTFYGFGQMYNDMPPSFYIAHVDALYLLLLDIE